MSRREPVTLLIGLCLVVLWTGSSSAQETNAPVAGDGSPETESLNDEEDTTNEEGEQSNETVEEAPADDPVALFHEGLEAYRTGRYAEAELLFERAHGVEPIADLSYNRARALENLGRLAEAADIYERYLSEAPGSPDRPSIESRIQNLRARVAEADPATLPPQTDAEDPAGPAWGGLLGPVLTLGGGVALMVTGIGTGVSASSAHDEALDPNTNQPDTVAANERADRRARWTNALFVVGGAATAAGVTWLVLSLIRRGRDRDEASVQVSLGPSGVDVLGRF